MIICKPKKIVVDLTPMLPEGENGGAKVFVLELLKQLANIAPETDFVLLTQAASHDELAFLDRPNMRRLLVVTPAASSRLRKLAKRLLPYVPSALKGTIIQYGYRINLALKRHGSQSLLHKIDADLLYCPFTAPTFYSPGVSTVCTIYDLQYKTYPEFFLPEDVAYRDSAFTEACNKADALVTISNFSRDEAIAYGKLAPSRINTVYLRTAKRFETERLSNSCLLEQLGIAPQRFLLYPANFWQHKNHERLITAFKMACETELDKDIKLICTGFPGARQDYIKNMAYEIGISDRILFPGYISNAELSVLMAYGGGLIFPSLYEGFGMPVVEAMAAGVPVACSNTTSLPEVASDAAILFDPQELTQISKAMITIMKDPSSRVRLIAAGMEHAEEFMDTERMAKEYCQVFSSCMN